MKEIQNLTPLFDIIRQHNPSFSEELAKNNPDLANVAMGKRILGDKEIIQDDDNKIEVYLQVANEAAIAAKDNIDKIRAVIDRKTKTVGRFGLAVGILTSFSMAVLLGAIVNNNEALVLVTAIIAFLSSILTLSGVYIETISGGEGSISRGKEDLLLIMDKLAQANSCYLVAKAQSDTNKALASLIMFNDVAEKCLLTGTRIGIKVS